MKNNIKQLLDALCTFDIDVQVNGTYGKLEKLGEGYYWLKPKRGNGFPVKGKMLETLALAGAVSFSSLN